MTTISPENLDHKLLTLDDLRTELSSTEPLTEVSFVPDSSDGDKVVFNLPNGWNHGIKDEEGTHLTEAAMSVNGKSYQLTKDAVLQATSAVGLTRDYVQKTPGGLVSDHLNYWYKSMPDKKMKLLASSDKALAFVRSGVKPLSNLALLDTLEETIHSRFGESEVLVDYKLHHDLRRTQFRLILPEVVKTITSNRSGLKNSDDWSIGVDFQNSLTAETGLQARGYTFAWWCTNGATSTHSKSGTFSRKGSPDESVASEWLGAVVDSIFDGLDHELDAVQDLVDVSIEGEVNHTMHDIFERYKVPAQARPTIMAELVEADDISMYGVMAAITAAANHDDLSPSVTTRLLEVGGDLPAATSGRCTNCHRLPI